MERLLESNPCRDLIDVPLPSTLDEVAAQLTFAKQRVFALERELKAGRREVKRLEGALLTETAKARRAR